MNKRTLLAIHKWLGLIAGLFILVMSLSGSILVFDDEIEHFLQRDVIYLNRSEGSVSLDAAYDSIHRKHPGWDVRFTQITEKSNRAIEAEIRRPNARRYLYLHPVTGNILRDLDSRNTFSYWMLKLHYTLHAGLAGEMLLLTTGIIFIGSLMTGFWFYRKSIWKVITLKIRLESRNLKSGASELHRIVGVWALMLNFIMALTGAIILFIIVSTNIQKQGPDSPPNPPEVTASLDSLYLQSQSDLPGFKPSYIRMPADSGRSITFYGHMDTDLPIHYEFSNYITYNPQTGLKTGRFLVREQPWSYDLLSFTYPLHFGDWGGIFLKLLYCLAGLSPPILSITGFIIWYKKKQKDLNPNIMRLSDIQRVG